MRFHRFWPVHEIAVASDFLDLRERDRDQRRDRVPAAINFSQNVDAFQDPGKYRRLVLHPHHEGPDICAGNAGIVRRNGVVGGHWVSPVAM